jgi:hypothetical protein
MDVIYSRISTALISLVVLFFITSCGGGSNSNGKNPDNPQQNGDLNGGLTGRLYVNNKDEGMVVDLVTGRAQRVPDVRWDETMNYSYGARFSAIPSIDGTEFLLTGISCEYHSSESAVRRHRDCLVLIDKDASILGSSTLYEGLWSGAKLSNDNKYVAFMYMDEVNDSHPPAELFIVDRDFSQIVSRTVINHLNNDSGLLWRDFDWAPNGQIVYGYDNSIYITSVFGTQGTLIYTAPVTGNNDDPFVYDPKVSPDGTRIAFRLMTNANMQVKEGNVWVMNIDGTDPHRLVYTSDYVTSDGTTNKSMQIYNDLAWSPDGEYILVAVGGTTGDIGSPGVRDTIYAVPSDKRDVPLSDSGENGIIQIRTYYDSPDSLTYAFEPYTGTITWLE